MISNHALSADEALGVAVQSDGKIVVSGVSDSYYNRRVAVTRHLPNGQLDPTFGSGGKVATPLGLSSQEIGGNVVLQSDGRLVVATTAFGLIGLIRYLEDGSLDDSFGEGGIALTAIEAGVRSPRVTAAPDGGFVVAGGTRTWCGCELVVARFDADGMPEFAFGDQGAVVTLLPDVLTELHSVAVQGDGKIVFGLKKDLLRLEANGTLDTSFDGDGVLELAELGSEWSVATDGEGRILAAGSYRETFVVLRIQEDGTFDDSFSEDGLATVDFGTWVEVSNLLIGADGAYTIAGGWSREFVAARFDSNGNLDASFGDEGRQVLAVVPAGTGLIFANDATLLADNGLVIAGAAFEEGQLGFAVVQLHADGSLNGSFAEEGILKTNVRNGPDWVHAILLQSDGELLAAGSTFDGYRELNIVVSRYRTDGELDTSFGSDGTVTIETEGDGRYSAYDLVQQADGKILVAGGDDDFAVIARLNADGLPDMSFASGGKLVVPRNSGPGGMSIGLQPSGRIVVSRRARDGEDHSVELIGLHPDGSLDAGFGDGGYVTTPATHPDYRHDLAIQDDGKIVVVVNDLLVGSRAMILRYRQDGNLDPFFGGHGVVDLHAAYGIGHVKSITLDEAGRILLTDGVDVFRLLPDGTMDVSYGVDGVAARPSLRAYLTDLAVADDGSITAAASFRNYRQTHSFAAIRFLPDGGVDTTFGVEGLIVTPIRDSAEATAITLDPQGRVILGGATGLIEHFDFALVRYDTNVPKTGGIDHFQVSEDAADYKVPLFPLFTDVNDVDEDLIFTVEGNTNPALFDDTPIDPVTGVLTLDFAADVSGAAAVTVRATDPEGLFVETSFNVTVLPDEPQVIANTGVVASVGAVSLIAGEQLNYGDTEQPPEEVTYTVHSGPYYGRLELSSDPGLPARSFSQADVNAGRLLYFHDGARRGEDYFHFDVDDGQGNRVRGGMFNITVAAEFPWQSAAVAYDVIPDNQLNLADLAALFGFLRQNGPGALTAPPAEDNAVFPDVQGDGSANLLDFAAWAGHARSVGFGPLDTAAPELEINTGLTLPAGAAATITGEMLHAADAQPAAAVLFQITAAPAHGRIERSTAPGVAVTSFTQQEVLAGRIRYVHTGDAAPAQPFADELRFHVFDTVGNGLPDAAFSITITQPAARTTEFNDARWQALADEALWQVDADLLLDPHQPISPAPG